jgi:hypothetical protein
VSFGFGVNSVADYAVAIVVGVGFSLLSYRIWRAGLRISEEGAVITSPVKRRTVVPLTLISAFEVDWLNVKWWDSENASATACVVLRRVDAAVLPIRTLASGYRTEDRTSRLQALCDELNALVSHLRGYEDATRPPAPV